MPPVTRTTARKFNPEIKQGCRVYAPCEGSPGLYPGTLSADVNNLCTVLFDDDVGTICRNIPKQRVLFNSDPKVSLKNGRTLFDNPLPVADKPMAAQSVDCGSCQQPVDIMHAKCRECDQICHAACFDTRLYRYCNVPICRSCMRESQQAAYHTDSEDKNAELSNHSRGPSNSGSDNDSNGSNDNQDTVQGSLQTQWPEATAAATVSKDEDDAGNV